MEQLELAMQVVEGEIPYDAGSHRTLVSNQWTETLDEAENKVAETDETVTRPAGGVKIFTKHQATKAKEKTVTAVSHSITLFFFHENTQYRLPLASALEPVQPKCIIPYLSRPKL